MASAHIKLFEPEGARPRLQVSLPRDTPFSRSTKVFARVDELILRLTGCPCNSGVDIVLREGIVNRLGPIEEQIEVG